MAVEQKKIKARLKALFPKANLSKKRLDEISARLAKKPADDADEETIDAVITDANDAFPFEDIAKTDDRMRTLEANSRSSADDEEDEEDEDEDPKPKPKKGDVPAWAQALIDANERQAQDLADLKAGKITESKTAAARKVFEQNEIFKGLKSEASKEFFFKQIDVNSETPLEEQIEGLEEVYKETFQTQVDAQSFAGGPPSGGRDITKPTDDEVASIVEDI